MITIAEIRSKYPQYEDLSDQDLTSKLHQKYYSDMPIEEFNQKIGFSANDEPASNKGWSGVSEDIQKGIKDIPGAFGELLSSLPGETLGAAKQAGLFSNSLLNPENGKRLGQNALGGLAQGGANLLNLPATIRDYLAEKELISSESPSMRLPEKILPRDFNYPEALGRKGQQSGDALIEGLTEALPFSLAGEIGLAGKGVGAGRKLGQRALSQGAAGGAAGENPITMGAMAPAMEYLSKALGKASKAAKKTGQKGWEGLKEELGPYASELSPEELEANLRATEGTTTNLGQVIGSPFIQKAVENVGTVLPFAQGNKALQKTGKEVVAKGENILDSLLTDKKGNPISRPADINEHLGESLREVSKQHEKEKSRLYDNFNHNAEKEGLDLELNNFEKINKDKIDLINNQPLLATEPKIKSLYTRISGLDKAGQKKPSLGAELESALTGKPITREQTRKKITAKEANILAGRFNYYAELMNHSLDPAQKNLAGHYRKMAKALKDDIRSSLEKHGSPELTKQFNDAEKNYSENYSPFLDRDLHQYTSGKKSTESLVTDVFGGQKHDKYLKVEKIFNPLSENDKNLFRFEYLRKALKKNGSLSPQKLKKQIDNLGERQFKTIFPDAKQREALLDFSNLTEKNTAALTTMFNPKTGARGMDMLGAALAKIGGTVLGGATGSLLAGIPGAALGFVLPGKMLKPFIKKWTNEDFRNEVVSKIIREKRIGKDKSKNSEMKEKIKKQISEGLTRSAGPLEIELTKYRKKQSD